MVKLVLMAEARLDQRRLVERAESDRVDDAVTRHFQCAVQIAERGMPVGIGHLGKPHIIGGYGLALMNGEAADIRPVTLVGVTSHHLDLGAGLRLPHFKQMPVADQQDVRLLANLRVGKQLGNQFGADPARVARDNSDARFHSLVSCSSLCVARFSIAVSIWVRMAAAAFSAFRASSESVMS